MRVWYSPADIEEMTGIDRDTVRKKWIHGGRLTARNFGSKARPVWRVHKTNLDHFIDSLPQSNAPIDRTQTTDEHDPDAMPPGLVDYIN